MSAPICPILAAGRLALRTAEADKLPCCIGSRCAWWDHEERMVHGPDGGLTPTGKGGCGLVAIDGGLSFWDPAKQEAP